MDKSITQLGQDLARAKYAEGTQKRYLQAAQQLAMHCQKPLAQLTREDVRGFVETVTAATPSAWMLRAVLSAVLFLFRRTLGRPELVSFIKLPRAHSPLPVVLSLQEIDALLRNVRNARYQYPLREATVFRR